MSHLESFCEISKVYKSEVVDFGLFLLLLLVLRLIYWSIEPFVILFWKFTMYIYNFNQKRIKKRVVFKKNE